MLDNDSLLPDTQFLARYAAAVKASPEVGLFVGGTTYEAAPPADPALHLRWHYGRQREMRPAAARQQQPGRQLTINNALLRADLLRRFPLDERLSGYGHEDTRNLAWSWSREGVAIQHLDNPVLHDGLEPANGTFLDKSRQAVRITWRKCCVPTAWGPTPAWPKPPPGVRRTGLAGRRPRHPRCAGTCAAPTFAHQ